MITATSDSEFILGGALVAVNTVNPPVGGEKYLRRSLL